MTHPAAPHNGQPTADVPISPTPLVVGVASVQLGTAPAVMLRFSTPQGIAVFFLPADNALEVANQIRHHARSAKSGLALPPPAGPDLDPPSVAVERADGTREQIPAAQMKTATRKGCGAELHLRVGDTDEWDVYPCPDGRAVHDTHYTRLPHAHPLAGVRWTSPLEGDGYRTTVP